MSNAPASPADLQTPDKMFGTDKAKETNGVEINYSGSFGFIVTRLGGSNTAHTRRYQKLLQPFQRQIQAKIFPPEEYDRLFKQAFVECNVVGWWRMAEKDGQLVREDGIMTGADGSALPFNQANVAQFLADYPDIYDDLVSQARDIENYRRDAIEATAKN